MVKTCLMTPGGVTDVDEDDGRGALGTEGEQMGPVNTNCPGG